MLRCAARCVRVANSTTRGLANNSTARALTQRKDERMQKLMEEVLAQEKAVAQKQGMQGVQLTRHLQDMEQQWKGMEREIEEEIKARDVSADRKEVVHQRYNLWYRAAFVASQLRFVDKNPGVALASMLEEGTSWLREHRVDEGENRIVLETLLEHYRRAGMGAGDVPLGSCVQQTLRALELFEPAATPKFHADDYLTEKALQDYAAVARPDDVYQDEEIRRQVSKEVDANRNALEKLTELQKKMPQELTEWNRIKRMWFEDLRKSFEREHDVILHSKPCSQRLLYGPYALLVPPEVMAAVTIQEVLSSLRRADDSHMMVIDRNEEQEKEASGAAGGDDDDDEDGHGHTPPYSCLIHGLSQRIGRELEKEAVISSTRDRHSDDSNMVKSNAFFRLLREHDTKAKNQSSKDAPLNKRVRNRLYHLAVKIDAEGVWDDAVVLQLGAMSVDHLIGVANVTDAVTGVREPAFRHMLIPQRNSTIHGVVQATPTFIHNVLTRKDLMKADKVIPIYSPMLVPPKPWQSNNAGGYLFLKTTFLRQKARNKAQVQAFNISDTREVREAIDILSRTKWKINKKLLDVINSVWYERGEHVSKLPPRNDLPVPTLGKKLSKKSITAVKDDQQREQLWKQRRALEKERSKTRRINAERFSLRCDTELKLNVAEEFRDEPHFYFPYNVDFRGRTYPIPPHLNHLGADHSRALLLFATEKPLGANGFYWLKVQLANLCGMDKISNDDRAVWTESVMAQVRQTACDPLNDSFWRDADEPFQCLAACMEIDAVLRHVEEGGVQQDYMCSLPVHQDGSCNGLQHYAALGRDRNGGALVNLVKADKPQDVYMGVCRSVQRRVSVIAADPEHPHQAVCRVIDGHVGRKVVKQTVMTSVYGVTFIGAKDQIKRQLGYLDLQWPEDMEDEAALNAAAQLLASMTLEGLAEVFEQANLIMKWLSSCAYKIATAGHSVQWTTPLGLPVSQPYTNERETVQTALQSISLSFKEDAAVAPKRQRMAFPPNFVHSLDSTHMMLTAMACFYHREPGQEHDPSTSIDFAAVHDSYWTHAGDVEKMNALLRDKFVELHSRPILEELEQSFRDRFPHIQFDSLPQRGDLDLEAVRYSPYFFS